jgi:hydroxymethylpyrimidine/phosphomethylpyrimidine kinase
MISKSGAALLKENAVEVLKKKLLPLATVLTPNMMEAEKLSGIEIHSLDDVKKVAKHLAERGVTAVVVKGGHLPTADKVVDTLHYEGKFQTFETKRVETMNTHGTGCTFASAIAAEMAKGRPIVEAVERAKEFVTVAIKFAYSIGGGYGPVNSMAGIYREAERHYVLREVGEALELLEKHPEVAVLIPETSSNLGMALSLAATSLDVVAIPGRISKVERGVRASSCPAFGASNHIAGMIIIAMKYDSSVHAAMNIRYSEDILKVCRGMMMVVSSYDRSKEPAEVKEEEGVSTSWGMHQAVEKAGGEVPDVVFHTGDFGKEPMMVLLGKNAIEVARRAISIAKELIVVSE